MDPTISKTKIKMHMFSSSICFGVREKKKKKWRPCDIPIIVLLIWFVTIMKWLSLDNFTTKRGLLTNTCGDSKAFNWHRFGFGWWMEGRMYMWWGKINWQSGEPGSSQKLVLFLSQVNLGKAQGPQKGDLNSSESIWLSDLKMFQEASPLKRF